MGSVSLIAGILSPFFVNVTPEVRTTYVSLGKIVEDRPMQVTSIKFGYDTGLLGRFGVRNWDVSSLTDRRADVHRHFLYHTEWGPIWQYDWEIADTWKLKNELTRSWTIYDGFENPSSEKTYHWWEFSQSLQNPYLTPFYRLRRCFRTSDYFYFRLGAEHRFAWQTGLYLTPGVHIEGGNGRNTQRVVGDKPGGGTWNSAVTSISFRLEGGWSFASWGTVFAFVEQYELTGGEIRDANADSSYLCAHNDWTHAGIGLRLLF